jgi:uncharacterized spore protein YtfJ
MESSQDSNKQSQPSFVEELAERLGVSAKAASVYGEAVERGGVTIIPVAKVKYGFGGGSGLKKTGEEGSGGGGGVSITPTGYIEIKEGNTRFRKIRDPQTLISAMAVGGIFTFLTVRSFSKMLQRKPANK